MFVQRVQGLDEILENVWLVVDVIAGMAIGHLSRLGADGGDLLGEGGGEIEGRGMRHDGCVRW